MKKRMSLARAAWEQKKALGSIPFNKITKYDKARTEKYLANTLFVNHGFNEEWHYENRIITTIFHSQIPVGMKLGAIISGDIVIEKPMTVKTTQSSCKQTKLKAGTLIKRSLIPVCGRLKK